MTRKMTGGLLCTQATSSTRMYIVQATSSIRMNIVQATSGNPHKYSANDQSKHTSDQAH